MSFQIGKYCRSKKPQSAARRQEILENRRRENSDRSEAIQAIIKTMEATDEFSNWEGHQHIAHHNNGRFLLELGAMNLPLEFLAQTEVPLGSLQKLNRGTGIAIDTLKSWHKNLRHDLQIVPYAQPANVRELALTKQQEDRIVQRIQSEFINQKKFCPAQLIQRMAIEIHREQSDKEKGGEAFDNEDPFIPRDHEEFLHPMKEKRKPFTTSWRWRKKFMDWHELSLRKPHAMRRPSIDLVAVVLHQIRMEQIVR
jgi:hypothetical protein